MKEEDGEKLASAPSSDSAVSLDTSNNIKPVSTDVPIQYEATPWYRCWLRWFYTGICCIMLLFNLFSLAFDRCGAANTIYQLLSFLLYLLYVSFFTLYLTHYIQTIDRLSSSPSHPHPHHLLFSLLSASCMLLLLLHYIYSLVSLFIGDGSRCVGSIWGMFILILDATLTLAVTHCIGASGTLSAFASYRHKQHQQQHQCNSQTPHIVLTAPASSIHLHIVYTSIFIAMINLTALNILSPSAHKLLFAMSIVYVIIAGIATILLYIVYMIRIQYTDDVCIQTVREWLYTLSSFGLCLLIMCLAVICIALLACSLVSFFFFALNSQSSAFALICWFNMLSTWVLLACILLLLLKNLTVVKDFIAQISGREQGGMATGIYA